MSGPKEVVEVLAFAFVIVDRLTVNERQLEIWKTAVTERLVSLLYGQREEVCSYLDVVWSYLARV